MILLKPFSSLISTACLKSKQLANIAAFQIVNSNDVSPPIKEADPPSTQEQPTQVSQQQSSFDKYRKQNNEKYNFQHSKNQQNIHNQGKGNYEDEQIKDPEKFKKYYSKNAGGAPYKQVRAPAYTPNYANLQEKNDTEEKMRRFKKALEYKKFDTPEFKDLVQFAISQMKQTTNFKQLFNFYRNLDNPDFRNKEYFNSLVEQSNKLKESFDSQDVNAMCLACKVVSTKQETLTLSNSQVSRWMIETTIKQLSKVEEIKTFKSLNFVISVLSRVPIDNYTIYDSILTQLEMTESPLNDFQWAQIFFKTQGLVNRLKYLPQYQIPSKILTKRMEVLMEKQSIIDRILKISFNASTFQLPHSSIIPEFPSDIELTVSRLAQALSQQIKIVSSRVLEDKKLTIFENEESSKTSEKNKEKDINNSEIDDGSGLREQSWKNIEKFILNNYQSFCDKTFKSFLESLSSAKVGTEHLYSQILNEFIRRIKLVSYSQINPEFYCYCIQYLFKSEEAGEGYKTHKEFLRKYSHQIFSSLSHSNKLILVLSYANTGEKDTIQYFLGGKQPLMQSSDIEKMSWQEQIKLFCVYCQYNIFQESLFETFILKRCDPSDDFFVKFPTHLLQVSLILHFVKLSQENFWKKNKKDFNERIEQFTILTEAYRKELVGVKSEYKKKARGSLEIADVLTAFHLDYCRDPIIERILNPKFLLKGISAKSIQGWQARTQGIEMEFDELRYLDYSFVKKYDSTKVKVDKKSDLLLEVQNNFSIVYKLDQYIPNLNVEILRLMGYKVALITHYHLKNYALLPKDEVIKLFLDLFIKYSPRTTKHEAYSKRSINIEDEVNENKQIS